MTEFKFEDLSKKTVDQLRKIAEGTDHEALQDPSKMPKEELLAALCQALGIEPGEPPEETAPEQEPAAPEETEETEETASESALDSSEEKVEDEEPVAQESEPTEPPKESAKEEAAAGQEDDASEPAPEGAEEEKPAAKESTKKKKAPAQEATQEESPPVVNKEKSKFKVQIRELKSQRNAALEAHDHVQLKSIRRRIRILKRKVRRIAV